MRGILYKEVDGRCMRRLCDVAWLEGRGGLRGSYRKDYVSDS